MMKRLLLFTVLSASTYFTLQAQKHDPRWEVSAAPGATEASRDAHRGSPDGEDATPMPLMPPGNDACASATNLTYGADCITGTTSTATTQGGEYLCISPGGGITPETVWYRFTAANDSAVIDFVITNTTNCATVLAVYGPFAPGAGCLPGVGSQLLCQNMGLIDPGFHPLLTGLVVGQQYLIQVQGNNCGGGDDRFANFCISVSSPASNIRPSTANTISACGVTFNGQTSNGYFNNGTSIGSNNLDGNAATTIAGASEVGDDVNFVVNNCSWFSFCNGNAGTCNWAVTVSGITNCLLPAPNAGIQAAVFGGTPAALTTIATSGAGAASIITPGSSWASGTFSLAAGACAYIVVDGFAGDQCDYTLNLTNVSCPCVVLPVELAWFSARDFQRHVQLDWAMASEDGIVKYVLEASQDGHQFTTVGTVPAGGKDYLFQDRSEFTGIRHYRLIGVDQDGVSQVLGSNTVLRGAQVTTPLVVSVKERELTVQYASLANVPSSFDVMDVNGRVVAHQQMTAQAGNQTVRMDLSGLEAGMYFVRASNGSWVQTAKFVLH